MWPGTSSGTGQAALGFITAAPTRVTTPPCCSDGTPGRMGVLLAKGRTEHPGDVGTVHPSLRAG